MKDQPTAELVIVQPSTTCVSYRLVANGRVVWSNRAAPGPEDELAALDRMAAWAKPHDYRVVGPRRRKQHGRL